jgi:hypothetical protein
VLFHVVESTYNPLLSRQRSRVRVPWSPPFIPKELGEFRRNHRGREKGAFRALFVSFLKGYVAAGFCLAWSDPPSAAGEKTSDSTAACAACFAGVTAWVGGSRNQPSELLCGGSDLGGTHERHQRVNRPLQRQGRGAIRPEASDPVLCQREIKHGNIPR